MKLHALVEDVETARAAVDGGATVVQLRLKETSTDDVVERGRGFRELPATFVVNDDVTVDVPGTTTRVRSRILCSRSRPSPAARSRV